jgi:hypothetical protein
MRTPHVGGLVLLFTLIVVGAQAAPQRTPAAAKPIAISGCVARSETAPDQLTIAEKKDGTTYRLSGIDVHDFVGQRVLIVGGVVSSKRLQISGGLKPSPNIAGQAGAIDPSQAATAAVEGSASAANVRLPVFRVRSVRPLGEGCPD